MSAHAIASRMLAAPVTSRRASSSDEFSPLREVVVGNPAGARIPSLTDKSAWLNLYGDLTAEQVALVPDGPFDDRIIEETAEDTEMLADTLARLGILVHRLPGFDSSVTFGAPGWQAQGFSTYCPRDLMLVVGNTLIETPSPMRSRYFETSSLKPLLRQYLLNGSPWISAPHPELSDDLFGTSADGRPTLGELEPVFEAANVLRCGRDLLYQVSASGNELGRVWLESTLRAIGDFEVHPLHDVYPYTHIDSTISLLRPGLILLNPERVRIDQMPAKFQSWDVIWCPPMTGPEPSTRYPLSSAWIGMNLLMTAPNTAIVDASQTALIRELESRHITVIAHTFRHARALGGGIHCATLDTVRDGGIEDYFA